MTVELQEAVYSRLNSNLSCPVYDAVPPNAEFPYVTIGEVTAIPFDTDDSVGFESTITIHVWSRYNGFAQIKRIQREIYSRLHRKTFDVDKYDLVGCNFEFSETILDPDGATRHGISRYRIITELAPLVGSPNIIGSPWDIGSPNMVGSPWDIGSPNDIGSQADNDDIALVEEYFS